MSFGRAPVTGVTVTYNSVRTLAPMLEAARRCHAEGVLDCVFVDNGSRDATGEVLQAESSWARVRLTGQNLGFGRGCNVGFAEVTSPYTLLINPDAVIEPEAIRTLKQFLDDHPKVGIVGPAVLEGEADQLVLQKTSARSTPLKIVLAATPLLARTQTMRDVVPGGEPFRTGWVCGAVYMIRTELLQKLGGFDPRFFLYWEETDLCQRAEDLGFETWAVGTAVARHIGGASSVEDGTRIGGCIAKHYYESRRYYMVKHHGWLAATAAELLEAVLLGARSLLDAARGRGWGRIRPRLQVALLSQPRKG